MNAATNRRTLLTGAAALAILPATVPARAQGARTPIVWWHAMTGANNDVVNNLARDFNASQGTVELQALFKGTYPETLNAAVAAWRAGQAPNLVQVFEVGTGTMLAAGPAVKQVWQLSKETGVPIDPANYIPAVRGYYSLSDGRMASMPFNSSTALMWYNKDAFEQAGLDPEKPPATWPEFDAAARALRDKWAKPGTAKGGQELYASTSSWLTWIQFETFAAVHNLPYATEADGFDGLNAQLRLTQPALVGQLQRLVDLSEGRRCSNTVAATARRTAVLLLRSGGGQFQQLRRAAATSCKQRQVQVGRRVPGALRPGHHQAAPINSIIGGASLWTMTAPNRPAERV